MRRSVVTCLWGAVCLLHPGTVSATNPDPSLQPPRIDAAITIDGQLEDAWWDAAHFDGFSEFMPNHGVPAQVPTEGYVAHTDTDLYVAFICHDPQIDRLRASMTDRDGIYRDDFVGVVIDTYRDYKRAYEFFANPHGIQGDMLWHASGSDDDNVDAIWQSHGGEDLSFDAIWESATSIQDDHWIVEMRIPLETMRFPDQPEQDWGIHFVRVFPRENRYEFSWQPISQDDNSFMGQAGNLRLSVERSAVTSRSLELIPYISGSRTDVLEGNSNGNGRWRNQDGGPASERIGLTGKYTISSDAAIDFAYKPDFSQIESDEGRINVNQPFAFFYEERRPFFMEGSDVFQVDARASGMILDVANLIYTRSINDPIVAGKFTGKSGRWTYGAISAYDDNTPLILPLADGTIVRRTRENAWSNIFRGQLELGDQTHIGFAATDRRFDVGGSNTAALVEGSWRLNDNYTWSALAAATRTDEPDDEGLSAIIPDVRFEVDGDSLTADFDGEQFNGYVLKSAIVRQSRTWNFNLSYQDYSPGFRADNSAIFSNDGRIVHTQHTYNIHFTDHRVLNFIRPGLYLWRKYDYAGDVKDTGIRPGLLVAFQHQTFFNLGGFLYNQEKFGGIPFDDARTLWGYLGTSAFERVGGGVFINRGKSINRFGLLGSAHNPLELVPTFEINGDIRLRPSDQWRMESSFNSTRLQTDATRKLIVRQRILRQSLQYQFSPQLFVRFIGEYNMTRRAIDVGSYNSSQNFSLEPMLSYKLNPFTVFYFGGTIGGYDDPYPSHAGLSRTDQSLFMKFQYLVSAS